ncbi:hypothetical protein NGRA_0125 [Nosema granulosis]|uniref:RWD domain-containing protein n=1 Tax=Nosema granulosis TaxID=83296 RepID=A0A9P6KZV3_9MICR|nr:hypothetical protein NGRA_0125 [Nosema granulosis]
MNEDLLLKTIFKDSLSINTSEEGTLYRVQFKKKVFEFECSKLYPSEVPKIRSDLTEEQLQCVYGKAKDILNSPMIYDLVLACVKQDELDLNNTVSTSVIVDYEIGDAPRITAEQFFNWVKENQRKPNENNLRTGRSIFESGEDIKKT